MQMRSNGHSGNVTLLFVEDDANEIFLLSRAVAKAQAVAFAFFVQTTQELAEYLSGHGKFADRGKYPLPGMIFTDYRLGNGSAKDVLNCVRQSTLPKDVPVVVLSSSVPPKEVDAMLNAGANAFFEKPLEFSGFPRVLENALKLAQN